MLLLGILLSFGSGVAALIYEVVWFQLLELVIGSTTVSLGMLLATFMGGMCLGSLMLPRLASAQRHPLRVYALIELGIGVLGILVLHLVPLVGGVYTAWSGYGLRGFVLRGAVAAACLVPPTLLMGATLPALSRQIEARRIDITKNGVSWLGFLYGANIAGAVLGCLLAGFYLLRKYDVYTATYAAMAINLSMAGLALALALLIPRESDSDDRVRSAPAPTPGTSVATIYVAISLSGLCALAAEATWTRMLGLLFGASVYALSIIVAVFLVGLGIGSGIGALLCRIVVSPRSGLGLVPMPGCLRDRLDRVQSGRIAPLLADQPFHLLKHLVQLRAGSRARVLGAIASDAPLGCELPPGACLGRILKSRGLKTTGCRQTDGRSLRR